MVTADPGLRYTSGVFTASITRGLRPLVTALTLILAACQQQEPPASGAPVDSEPVAVETLAPAPPREAVAATPAEPPPEPVTETRPLQLDIPSDILDEGADTGFPEQPSRLPDLFAKKKKTGTSVSGELLFEEGEDAALDTMSGAKITIQIPVDE